MSATAPPDRRGCRVRCGCGTGSSRRWSACSARSRCWSALVQVIGRYFDPAQAITWAEEVIVYLIDLGDHDRLQPVGAHATAMCGLIWCCAWCRRRAARAWRCSIAWSRSCSAAAWSGTAGRSSIPPADRRNAVPPTCSSRCGSTIVALPVGSALMLVRYMHAAWCAYAVLLRSGDDDRRAHRSRTRCRAD